MPNSPSNGPPSFSLRALGNALARRRQMMGITQYELAERLGLQSPETISRYERGDREPRVSTLVRLAEALDTDAVSLLSEALADCDGGRIDSGDLVALNDSSVPDTGPLPANLSRDVLLEALLKGFETAMDVVNEQHGVRDSRRRVRDD